MALLLVFAAGPAGTGHAGWWDDVKEGAGKAGKQIKEDAKKAGKAIKKGAKKAGKAIKKGARKTGEAIKETGSRVRKDDE